MHTAARYSPKPRRAEPLLLVSEISHRVINEYSQAIAGIRLAAREVICDQAQNALTTAAARLSSFAEAHRALQVPIVSGDADLSEALTRLCSTMSVACLEERGITLTLSTVSLPLAPERCWRIALIVSELITNSVRHGLGGRPGNIRVETEVGSETTVIRVDDDGCSTKPVRPGRGFDVVTGLASEIGGSIGWCFGPDRTTAELHFPNWPAESLK